MNDNNDNNDKNDDNDDDGDWYMSFLRYCGWEVWRMLYVSEVVLLLMCWSILNHRKGLRTGDVIGFGVPVNAWANEFWSYWRRAI